MRCTPLRLRAGRSPSFADGIVQHPTESRLKAAYHPTEMIDESAFGLIAIIHQAHQ
jgi:hypothetical protein